MNPTTDPNQTDPNAGQPAAPVSDPYAGQAVPEAPTVETPAAPEAPVTPAAPADDTGVGGDQNPAGGAPVI